ncbi:MAG TPA: hypothetical protein VGB75_10890 [Jatrophihabitans sp.]
MTVLIADHLVRRAPWQLLSFGHRLATTDEIVDEPLLSPPRLVILS